MTSGYKSFVTLVNSPATRLMPPKCNHKECNTTNSYHQYQQFCRTSKSKTPVRDGVARSLSRSPKRKVTIYPPTHLSNGGYDLLFASEGAPEFALTPDMSLVNLLRYCVVAMQLLPENSISGNMLGCLSFYVGMV